MKNSLRRRLVLILLALTLVTWLVSVVLTAFLSQRSLLSQIDRQLSHYMDIAEQTTSLIFSDHRLARRYLQESRILSSETGLARSRGFGTKGREQAVNLWFVRRQVLVGELAPRFPTPEAAGFITSSVEGGDEAVWRILYRQDERTGNWMAVGVSLQNASMTGTVYLLGAILPLLLVLPVSVPLLLWGVRRGLRPLDRIAEKIESRKPQVLDPIEVGEQVPLEIQPVVVALNGLLDRLQRALESESRFTANAAHELQTPLAAIKAEVQRYQRRAGDDDSRQMLGRISTRTTRATNTVTQLLTLARLDPEQEFQHERVLLNELVLEVIAEEGDTAIDRKLDIHLSEPSEVALQGQPDWLKILIRNLIANAFRHSPEGGEVEISLSQQQGAVRLRVCNDCSAMPDEQRQQLIDRFYTLPGNTASGVGLGLSIASRIVELHGGRLRLEPWRQGEGFAVSVDFSHRGSVVTDS